MSLAAAYGMLAEKVWVRPLMTHWAAGMLALVVVLGIVGGMGAEVIPIAAQGLIQLAVTYWYFFRYERVVTYYGRLSRREEQQ